MHSALVRDIWVEAWIARSGQTARTSCSTPRSWTNTASTPVSANVRMVFSTIGSSLGKASVLSVT